MTPTGRCLGALALELTPGSIATRPVLDQETAGALSALVARDLAKHAHAVAQLDLALIAALFDPVELLRPGWPLHGELERLVAQAPGPGEPRVIAIGGHEGALPDSLQPDRQFTGGALRLVPLLLHGDAAVAAAIGAHFEAVLLDVGMAGADTALLAQQAFGAPIEHARYLTINDLAAMTALQYEHAGLSSVWPLIEAALLAPEQEQWLDAPPEPLVRMVHGQARMAMLDDQSWLESPLAHVVGEHDPQRLGRAFDRYQMRQRQIAALLEAHGIAVTFDHCPAWRDAHATLRA